MVMIVIKQACKRFGSELLRVFVFVCVVSQAGFEFYVLFEKSAGDTSTGH